MVDDTKDLRDGQHVRWCTEIELYDRESSHFTKRGKKVLRRYKDERKTNETMLAKYNILWSITQTIMPAVFAQAPKPNVQRRHRDKDNLSRITSLIEERCISYFIESTQFSSAMNDAVRDRLLPGRGLLWVRYEPHFRDAAPIGNPTVQDLGVSPSDDAYPKKEDSQLEQELYYEQVCYEWVNWKDFGHTCARCWEEVDAIWRIIYMTRDQLVKRFGKELGSQIPLDCTVRGETDKDKQDSSSQSYTKKARIYEIWSKRDMKAIWLHRSFPKILDEIENPLRLPDFFPCAKPMYATLDGDDLFPTADFIQYQDQAEELDRLTAQIVAVTRCLKVMGVYASSAEGIQRLFTEGNDEQLIPITDWQQWVASGGLKGVVELVDLTHISNALIALHESRQKVLDVIYDIMGIPDILRGVSDPRETAKAQSIKSAYATTRLGAIQRQVQQHARDVVRITGHIIAEHFTIDTIKKISGVTLLTQAEKQQIMMNFQRQQMQYQMAQQQMAAGATGMQKSAAPKPPTLPDEIQELIENPTWEEVEALLRDEAEFGFKIDIETDSTIKMDQDDDRAARIEFLQTAGAFIREAGDAIGSDPILAPLVTKMLMFGIRGFNNARELEGEFEITVDKVKKRAEEQEQNPQKTDPEMAKAQAEIQMEQQKQAAQLEADKQTMSMKLEMDKQRMLMENQLEERKMQMEGERETMRMQQELVLERERAQLELQLKERLEIMKVAADERKYATELRESNAAL